MANGSRRARANERPRYQAGGMLSAPDLAAEQAYRRGRLRQHLRRLHGWGVVCGLQVLPAPSAAQPWRVRVCPGYAIGPCGDEIVVPQAVTVDVAETAWQAPPPPAGVMVPALRAVIAIRFDDEPLAIVSVPAANRCRCACDEVEQASRIKDGFRIDVLWTKPAEVPGDRIDMCVPGPVPCPPGSSGLHVLLASIVLPGPEESIGADNILMP